MSGTKTSLLDPLLGLNVATDDEMYVVDTSEAVPTARGKRIEFSELRIAVGNGLTMTLPYIYDTSADHTYNILVSELAANRDCQLPILLANDEFVFKDHIVELTGKTINSTNNTITNIVNADIKATAAIDATKIGSGDVTNTELDYIKDSTSAILGKDQAGTVTNRIATSIVLNTGVSGTAVKDEDDMVSNSATHICTQQSIKAYVDGEIITESTIARTLALADKGAYISHTNVGASTCTVPLNASVEFPLNTVIKGQYTGSASLTIVAAGGVTITRISTLGMTTQYGEYKLRKVSTDGWKLSGDFD